ncbi:MAG: peptidase [Ignavibacteriae bacterium]|nr:MAG: peptidase [Ignavibacteriota bacterium]
MSLIKSPKHKELKPEELKFTCNSDSLNFETTEKLLPIDNIVGQHRAIKALKLGIDIESAGYNIFITGISGTGKQTTIKKMLNDLLPNKKAKLSDYIYANNFRNPDHPALLVFPAGSGRQFKNDLEETILLLRENIPLILEKEPFVTKRNKLLKNYTDTQQKMMGSFEKKLNKDNLTLGQVKIENVTRPEIFAIIEDKAVYIQALGEFIKKKKITKEQAQKFVDNYNKHQDELKEIFRESIKQLKESQAKIVALEAETVKNLVNAEFDELRTKYKNKSVKTYLDRASESILENLEVFKPTNNLNAEGVEDYFANFEINLILDNSNIKNAPIIIETSPTFSNLFGIIEKVNRIDGMWVSDFRNVKSGSLLKANNGFLIINALEAINEPGVWKTLKRVLFYGKLEIQDIASLYQVNSSALKPEPIEINCKVIMLGNNYTYSMLSEYEDDFKKIFKVKAEFDYEMSITDKSIAEYARVIKKIISTEKLSELDNSAVAKVIEYGARFVSSKNKLTTKFSYIADLLREADFWAKDVGNKVLTKHHITKAYNSMIERHSLHESKLKEMINEEMILINTDGTKIGQINGLAVYGGDYSFGKPTKITSSVGLGNGSIINVEREAGLSGNTHNKGILIITGYFREKFGKQFPLSFTASIVFEQGYGKIDGDSASVTEICALLSGIAEIPINQSFAITGSINQKGEIQPIGGVNEKIEGFYDLCKERGFTKKQGVIIPYQNVKDLMLKDEIIESVKNKEFHIYSIKNVDEAIEILTGIKAGKLLKNNRYQANTVFGEVEKKLREMKNRTKQNKKQSKEKKY